MNNYIILLIILNVFSFSIYFYDKMLSIYHRYRISENMLILSSIVAPFGAIIAMIICNHKHHKMKFRIFIPLFVIINLAIYIYLYIIK